MTFASTGTGFDLLAYLLFMLMCNCIILALQTVWMDRGNKVCSIPNCTELFWSFFEQRRDVDNIWKIVRAPEKYMAGSHSVVKSFFLYKDAAICTRYAVRAG